MIDYETRDSEDPNHGDGSGYYGLPCATLTLMIVGVLSILYAIFGR